MFERLYVEEEENRPLNIVIFTQAVKEEDPIYLMLFFENLQLQNMNTLSNEDQGMDKCYLKYRCILWLNQLSPAKVQCSFQNNFISFFSDLQLY